MFAFKASKLPLVIFLLFFLVWKGQVVQLHIFVKEKIKKKSNTAPCVIVLTCITYLSVLEFQALLVLGVTQKEQNYQYKLLFIFQSSFLSQETSFAHRSMRGLLHPTKKKQGL